MPAIAQQDTAFSPSVVVIPVGAKVAFPNKDPFFHNVFSYSSTERFDLGRYPQGESKTVVFGTPGMVNVYCEVPNLVENLDEWGYNLEAQIDVAAGVFVSGRFGMLDFRPLNDGLGTGSSLPGGQADWDYDTARYEFGMGYRLARNAGLLGSFMHNVTTWQDPDDDLWSVRLWWRF
jgi:hypothetical protein